MQRCILCGWGRQTVSCGRETLKVRMTAEWIFFKMARWEKLSSIETVAIECSTNALNFLNQIEAKMERSISQFFDPTPVTFALNFSQNRLIDFTALISDSSLSAKGISANQSVTALICTISLDLISYFCLQILAKAKLQFFQRPTNLRTVFHSPTR
jgi:hypothetical protein